MKRYWLLILTALLIVTSVAVAKKSTVSKEAAAAKESAVYSDPTKPILVDKNSREFTITLKSNPTTGYSWFLGQYNHHIVSVISHRYVAPDTKLIGAGGKEVWVFKVSPDALVAPQILYVNFIYTRLWELGDRDETRFTVMTR